MDPIGNQLSTRLVEQFTPGGPRGGPGGSVDPAAQLQFEQALHPSGGAAPTAAGEPPGARPLEASPASAKPSLGDAILDGIEKLKTHHDVRAERIEQTLIESGGDLTMEEMMKLQFEVMQLGIEQDITTKMADKTSSGVQTLFRNQG